MATWLKGLTTWGNLASDLTKLVAGEITDGAGNTAASGDRWVREIAGQDLLRSNAAADVALGNMSNRSGYWTLGTNPGNFGVAGQSPSTTVCRTTNVFTSSPGGGKWWVAVFVRVANTVAGDYSNATLDWMIVNADTGASISTNGSGVCNAAGVRAIANGMVVTVSDPSGILGIGSCWLRQFDTTFMGGIDWFGPFIYNKNATAVSFSINPGGSQPTDWDIADTTTTSTPAARFAHSIGAWVATFQRGGIGQGVGIKTNAGLTGGLYTFTFTAAKFKIRLQNGASAGQIAMTAWGDLGNDAGTYRSRNGSDIGVWLRPFQTPGSVVSGSPVQYWISVGPDHIHFILNGDPLYSGKLCMNSVGTFTPYNSVYDKFPTYMGKQLIDFTADNTNYTPHIQQKWTLGFLKMFQDGSEGRDWQTAWMRVDMSIQQAGAGIDNPLWIGTGSTGGNFLFTLYTMGYNGTTQGVLVGFPIMQDKGTRFDNKWWLLQLVGADTDMLTSTAASANVDINRIHRGTIDGILFTSSQGWSSGDELTDTDTLQTYFLVAPDYLGMYFRARVNPNDYRGGLAILETT